MKCTYLLKKIKSLIPYISITLLLIYIVFNANPTIGSIGFLLSGIYDLHESYLEIKYKNDINTLNIILSLIMLILSVLMIIYPSFF